MTVFDITKLAFCSTNYILKYFFLLTKCLRYLTITVCNVVNFYVLFADIKSNRLYSTTTFSSRGNMTNLTIPKKTKRQYEPT